MFKKCQNAKLGHKGKKKVTRLRPLINHHSPKKKKKRKQKKGKKQAQKQTLNLNLYRTMHPNTTKISFSSPS